MLAAALCAVSAAGCGQGEDARDTSFQQAIASAGGGVSATGVGMGWVDMEVLPRRDLAWAAAALGPGAATLVDQPAAVERELAFDPAAATQALAITTSYALAVRLEGVGAPRLASELVEAGASRSESGRWSVFDLGNPAEGETSGPLATLGALASRTAVSPQAIVLARDEGARTSLIRAEPGELGSERIDLATDCLGDVVAARLVPGTFTFNVPAAPELIAFGVRSDSTEALCAIDLESSAGDARDDAMRAAFARGARDGVTGEPIASLFAEAEITRSEGAGGATVTRAVLTRAPGSSPGEILEAFPRGSTLTYLGSRRPIPLGAGSDDGDPRG